MCRCADGWCETGGPGSHCIECYDEVRAQCGECSCMVPFCETCGLCEECCRCAEQALDEPEPQKPVLTRQPAGARRSLIANVVERCEKPLIFTTGVRNLEDCTYQWYQVRDGGASPSDASAYL